MLPGNSEKCMSFRDPQADVIASYNKLMILGGMFAAKGVANPDLQSLDAGMQVNYTATGHPQDTRSVYHTNYWYFLGAALIEVICIALVAPTFVHL